MPEKICNICKTNKKTSEYNKEKSGIYGVRAVCRECKREIDRNKYAEHKKNGTLKAEPEYTKDGKSYKDLRKEISKKFYRTNKEQILKKLKAYRERPGKKERALELQRKYLVNNRDHVNERSRLYMEKKRKYKFCQIL